MASPALTIAYIEKRPQSAARVLASMDAGDAAAFIEAIPTRFAVRVASRMTPWAASSLLSRMNATGAAAILREIGYREAVAILRLAPGDARLVLLNELPKTLKRDFEVSLSFPDDTVGAHMTIQILALTGSHTVAETLDQVQRSPQTEIDTVFIISDSRMFVGAVRAAALLRHPPDNPLSHVMDATVTPLSARARLPSVAELDAWDAWLDLPVISRNKELIGALSRTALRRASDLRRPDADIEGSSIAGSLMGAYFDTLAELARIVTDTVPSSRSPGDGGNRS